MALLIFNNLIRNGTMDSKRCELFSCLVVNNRKMSVDELQEQFPRVRKPTIIKNCDVLYYCTWLDKEEKEDGSVWYEINRPAVRQLLIRCGETFDDVLGLQLRNLKEILGPDGIKDPSVDPIPNCGGTEVLATPNQKNSPSPAAAPNSAPVENSLVNPAQKSLNDADGGGHLLPAEPEPKPEQPVAVPVPAAPAPAAGKQKKRKAFVPPTIEEATAEARRIISNWRGHPEVIGLNPQRCAEEFIDFYTSKGWVISGGQPMKCWTSALSRAIHTPWSSMAASRVLTPQDRAKIYSCGMEKYFIEHGIEIPPYVEAQEGEYTDITGGQSPQQPLSEYQQLRIELAQVGKTRQKHTGYGSLPLFENQQQLGKRPPDPDFFSGLSRQQIIQQPPQPEQDEQDREWEEYEAAAREEEEREYNDD